jgi:Ca-activated chloride channel family protein
MFQRIQKRVALVLLLVVLCVPLSTTHAQGNDLSVQVTQVDTSNYPEVTVYVSATDASGQAVSRLRQDDFSLTEDGTAVDVIGFQGGGQSQISTVLVIDHSGSMAELDKMEGAREAAAAFVAQMVPGDQTALVAFASSAEILQGLTENSTTLNRAMQRLLPVGDTALYDSIMLSVDVLKGTGGRRVLLLLTDGKDSRHAGSSSSGSRHTLDEAIAYANTHEQPMYVVGLGKRGDYGRAGIDEQVLRRIADETGGRYFYAPDAEQLAALYDELAGALHEEYALTYRSPRPFYDGTRRDIQVQVGANASTSSAYTEQHLINVHSNFLVGVLLLLPLLVLLVLPSLMQGQWKSRGATEQQPTGFHVSVEEEAPPSAASPTTAAGVTPVVNAAGGKSTTYSSTSAANSSSSSPGSSASTSDQSGSCISCGQPLRPGAKFCGVCGTKQTEQEGTRGDV